jgi:hypothetical protein
MPITDRMNPGTIIIGSARRTKREITFGFVSIPVNQIPTDEKIEAKKKKKR